MSAHLDIAALLTILFMVFAVLLDAGRDARARETPKELERKVEFLRRSTTADAIYLRLIIHCNEHMGQLVAYARMTGVTPPWSKD
jgi:uncharacterized damage-inducible protein DinB